MKAEAKAKLSIYAICFNMLIYLVLSVSIAGAVASFPDQDPTAVQYLITVPSLACIAGTFLVPLLGSRLSQKTLSVSAQAASIAGAAIYVFFPRNLPVLYAASVIIGLAYGVLATTFPVLVNIHIAPERRNTVTGIASGMVQFGRLASLMIAGFLGDIQWNFVYLTYFLVVASLCILVPCLPPDQPLPKSGSRVTSYGQFFRSAGFWELVLADFLFGILNFMISTHVSLYIEGYGLGTASTTGVLSSLSCGVAGLVACFFAPIYKRTGKNTLFLIFLCVGIGYALMGSITAIPIVFLGVLLCNAAAAVFTPYILVRAGQVAAQELVPFAVSMAVASLNVGFFVSPGLSNWTAAVLLDGSPAAVYLIGGLFSLVLAAVCLFLFRTRRDTPSVS